MISESAHLARIRDQLAGIAPGEWSRVYDGNPVDGGCFIEARGPMGELSPVLRFDAGASTDEIAFVTEAPDNVRFLLGLVDRAIQFAHGRNAPSALASARAGETSPGRQSVARREANYAAECAMKCAEPVFRAFLEQRHGLERPLTDERVAQKVRGLLGVTSRAKLNDNDQAAERWKALRGDFDAWLKYERGAGR